MATLVSTSVTATQRGEWPQLMTVVQEFDHPVLVTEDFKAIFYTRNTNPIYTPAQMTVAPVQYVPTQLSYTIQVSPFADGDLGVQDIIGFIQDVYGNTVDLKIGNDFEIYNTILQPYYSNPRLLTQGWLPSFIIPPAAICPGTTAPQIAVKTGPWESSMQIPDQMWSGGNFYIWCNYTWKPDEEGQGVPFVWEPPFYYSFSQFGIPYNQSISAYFPPFPDAPENILNNIISSGTQDGWDTCGWIDSHPKWKGRVQVWVFGDDVFADGVVPWTFPGVANPTGDLSPNAQFGFPPDAQLQFYLEQPFSYIAPNP